MKHVNSTSREHAPVLRPVLSDNSETIANRHQLAIDEMHSAVGSNLHGIRSKIKAARLEKIMARHLENELTKDLKSGSGQEPEAVKEILKAMASSENGKLTDTAGLVVRHPLALHKGTQEAIANAQAAEAEDNQPATAEEEKLIATIAEQTRQIEMLEKLQKADAEKIRTLQFEIAKFEQEFGEILENKESQVCDLISDIRRYDSANRQLQDELFNLQDKFNGLASENAERQSAQFSRIRELETELQKANQQLKVRDLEFEALATEHESVNRLLTLNEQMVSALSQQPVKTAADQA